MAEPRKLKKSESLEIRIPYPTKEAFMARCRDDGRSASDVLRGFIDGHIDGRAKAAARRARKRRHLVAGALIATAVGAVALPSLARPNAQAQFARMDLNGDGALSLDEYQRSRDAGGLMGR